MQTDNKYSTKNINKSNTEIMKIASANVDIHDENQSENILIDKCFTNKDANNRFEPKQQFCSLCFIMYIYNHSTYDAHNFNICFILTLD